MRVLFVAIPLVLLTLAYAALFGWFVLAYLKNHACTVNDSERIRLYYHD